MVKHDITSETHSPVEYLKALREERAHWSDDAILTDLALLPVLPDEEDAGWDDLGEDSIWHSAYLYTALADMAAERKLKAAIPLILERACFGDPGEMMRGIRHRLERIVNPDMHILRDYCMQVAQSEYKGARYWAIRELGVLREKASWDILIAALDDLVTEIASEAASSLNMLCQTNEDCRQPALVILKAHLAKSNDQQFQKALNEAIGKITAMS
jgi:hypothetical protein